MKLKFNPFLIMLLLAVSIVVGFVLFKAIKSIDYAKKSKEVPIIVGFAQLGSESAWRNANTKSVIAAAEAAGITLIYKNAEGNQKLQQKIIKDFILQQVDVIIIPPLVTSGWEPILTEAKEANIPVIIADRTIVPDNQSLYSVFVGEDFLSEGQKAGRWLVQNTEKNIKTNIVELRGLAGSAPTTLRAKGFRLSIKNYPNLTFLDSVSGDFIKVRGKLEMQKLLKKHGKNIDVVFAHNDDMALGAIEAIEEYGLQPGVDILIISVDGERAALQAIKDGKSNVSVECTPLLGPALMNAARKIVKGEKVPKKIFMGEKTFTKENVDYELPLRTY